MTSEDWYKIQKRLHTMECVEPKIFAGNKIPGHPKLAAVRETLNWIARNYTLTPKQ